MRLFMYLMNGPDSFPGYRQWVAWHEDSLHLHVDPSKGSTILLHPSSSRGQVRLAEMFGGLSGWSWAARECGQDVLLIIGA